MKGRNEQITCSAALISFLSLFALLGEVDLYHSSLGAHGETNWHENEGFLLVLKQSNLTQ